MAAFLGEFVRFLAPLLSLFEGDEPRPRSSFPRFAPGGGVFPRGLPPEPLRVLGESCLNLQDFYIGMNLALQSIACRVVG